MALTFFFALSLISVVELACGEYGMDKIKVMVDNMENGDCSDWFHDPSKILKLELLRKKYPLKNYHESGLVSTPQGSQLKVLMQRGWIKTKRDSTLTHLR